LIICPIMLIMFLSILSITVARCLKNIRTSIAVDPSFKVDPIIVSGDIPDYAKDGNAMVVSYFKGVTELFLRSYLSKCKRV
jgi:hypothetical protein